MFRAQNEEQELERWQGSDENESPMRRRRVWRPLKCCNSENDMIILLDRCDQSADEKTVLKFRPLTEGSS